MKMSFIRRAWLGIIAINIILFTGLAPVWAAEPAGDKVAVVNDAVITRQELDKEVQLAKNRMAAQGQPVPEDTGEMMSAKVLDQLIDMELLWQESQKQKIEITEKLVTDHLDKFRARFPSAEAYEKALKEMNISEAELKDKTKKGLAIQELIEKQVTAKIEVTEDERRNFYDSNPKFFEQPEQVEASHILIKSDSKDDKAQQDKALEKIKEVEKKVKAGEDFASLAKEYSEGPSGKNGGALGYFGRGQMVKPFEDAAFGLEPGKTSDIVKTRFGYHLIKVTGKKPAGTISYDEVKDKIGAHLKQQKTNESINAYIETLKKNAKIEKSL